MKKAGGMKNVANIKNIEKKPKIAISIGDLNGVGLEIILRELKHTLSVCEPIFCAHKGVLYQALEILKMRARESSLAESTPLESSHIDFDEIKQLLDSLPERHFAPPAQKELRIKADSSIDKTSGAYSFASFIKGVELAESHASALLTLPIHKAAWKEAGVAFAGHTEALRARYDKEAIMMLGCAQMFVALFSDHIALERVSACISVESYTRFLINFANTFSFSQALVLGFNPHCGDNGAIGSKEDELIQKALRNANETLGRETFAGIVAPDSAFAPHMRAKFRVFVAPYHDIGLAPLKALYFDESINISLNLPINRVSVDHGVAFDIAYKGIAHTQSYRNALDFGITKSKKPLESKKSLDSKNAPESKTPPESKTSKTPSRQLILASTSPTRAEILRAHGIEFIQLESGFDEDSLQTSEPKSFVFQACQGKMDATLKRLRTENRLESALDGGILVADSVISVGGVLQRKAKSAKEARNMLEFQSAKRISVITAMSYQSARGALQDMSACHLELDGFALDDMLLYLDSGEWRGKAGCVMVEGFHRRYIRRRLGLESCARGLSIERLLAFWEIV